MLHNVAQGMFLSNPLQSFVEAVPTLKFLHSDPQTGLERNNCYSCNVYVTSELS